MSDEKTSAAELRSAIDIAPWSDLVRHFAFGRVLWVSRDWNLVEAALALHNDEAERVKLAMRDGKLRQPLDSEVADWKGRSFHTLVISPFVLIQDLPAESAVPRTH